MISKVIGVGAAGNKAAINLVEQKVISIDSVMLINSTLKDIPADYKGLTVEYKGSYGGCGKERAIAKDLVMKSIMEDHIPLESFLHIGKEDQAELVIIVTSTEGGTGSGSSLLLAKYIKESLGINVHVFGFLGFQADVRGLRNTVEWFQELQENFAVEAVENSKYLAECRGNKIKAEKAANADFAQKIGILLGNPIRYSEHNIDATDLLKVSSEQTGFMMIESANFERIKNREQFEQMVINMIDNSKSVDVHDINAQKIAVFININPSSSDYISYEEILEERYGMAGEVFLHIQHEADMPEFFAIIVAGIKMPIDEIQKVYTEYKDRVEKVDKSKDSFFAAAGNMSLEDDGFMSIHGKKKETVSKADFFKNLGQKLVEEKPEESSDEGEEAKGSFSNKKIVDNF